MPIPPPRPGLVIRYDYVWSHEASAGRTQGKDRPACLVVAGDPAAKPRSIVLLPITHSQPIDPTVGVEVPPRVRQAIGLDDERCWVIVSEFNVDEWPNSGLRPIPGRRGVFAYGLLPPRLFADIRERFLDLAERGRSKPVRR